MDIKDLKKIIKNLPDDREVMLVGWVNDETVLQHTHPHPTHESVNQLWLSMNGSRIK